ncbi:unnamed protein product [Trifolium pratense]|uniref:Uncharacterized protein n=1 Tax=Trifolium pratense TaxID=57577 RepID=A0ACB0L7R0_TRIPR|nr:unnamed protein product [Trifolium pratense]
MASKTTSLIRVALILFVFSLCTIKLVGASEIHASWYEMAGSRRLLGQEKRGPIKKICENGESSLIDQNKEASDQPRCGNYHKPMNP